jgi:hypothetical protein
MATVIDVPSHVSDLRRYEGMLRELEHETKELVPRVEYAEKKYESARLELDETRDQAEENAHREDDLRSIIEGIARLIGQTPAEDSPRNHPRITPRGQVGVAVSPPRSTSAHTSASRPGLAKILETRLIEVRRITADEALAYASTLPVYRNKPPSRDSAVSRLAQLVREGFAVKNRYDKQVYELAR